MLAGRAAEAGCPSSTSTRSAARTSWSSTGPAWWSGPTAASWRPAASSKRTWWWSTSPWPPRPARPARPSRSPTERSGRRRPRARPRRRHPPLGDVAEVYEALVLGTRDYLAKNGFTGAVVGLSGGIDSSLVAAVAADAIGPDRVTGCHALALLEPRVGQRRRGPGRNGWGSTSTGPDRAGPHGLADLLAPVLGDPPAGLVDENLQSRLRGVVLMAFSNATGASCSPPATRARWPPATRPSTATRPGGSP